MLSSSTLVFRYTLFAGFATLCNIASQELALRFYRGSGSLYVAMILGTFVGLILKYTLDKKWIFSDSESGAAAHGKKFTLYTLMGIATTAIFWGSELFFHYLGDHPAMKYLGAAIGLSIGYMIKYHLDKRFVFNQGHRARSRKVA